MAFACARVQVNAAAEIILWPSVCLGVLRKGEGALRERVREWKGGRGKTEERKKRERKGNEIISRERRTRKEEDRKEWERKREERDVVFITGSRPETKRAML